LAAHRCRDHRDAGETPEDSLHGSLVLGGLLLGVIHLPILSPLQPGHRPDWLTPM
jgi:hypothetical protein